MTASHNTPLPDYHLTALFMLARRLERHENSGVPVDATLYRYGVRRLQEELQAAPADAALDALLELFPATTEVYENLHYAQTGLCRSEPAAAVTALLLARKAIARARRGTSSKQRRRSTR